MDCFTSQCLFPSTAMSYNPLTLPSTGHTGDLGMPNSSLGVPGGRPASTCLEIWSLKGCHASTCSGILQSRGPGSRHASTCLGTQFLGGLPASTCLGTQSPGGCHASPCLGICTMTWGCLALRLAIVLGRISFKKTHP